jgi:acetoin utilization deacetylase AcuC-like enzyme
MQLLGGSQGSWMAAVCGVAAAVVACDKVVRGECVNAFCVTRPPGHHAGRSLHPMKAISNGFCLLNPVACAAIHATSPISLGGLGLSRVCVLDFDVHHGNGTQDILASTYDPRFLYISIHAGGAHINGIPNSDDPSDEPYGLTKNPNMVGIYPGRCGDTSPHEGVLNIPLGAKVLSHGVGTALLQRVTPAVEAFAPDLLLLSTGFDAHKNDPMGLGGLSAADFGNITDVACQLALKYCSGRVVSVLEGGYGVPCCRPQQNTFLPASLIASSFTVSAITPVATSVASEIPPLTTVAATEASLIASSVTNPAIIPVATSVTSEIPPLTTVAATEELKTTVVEMNGSKDITLPSPVSQPQLTIQSTTPTPTTTTTTTVSNTTSQSHSNKIRPQPSRLLDLSETIPDNMDDQVPYPLQVRLEKCHTEGFVECVYEHVSSLARCTDR